MAQEEVDCCYKADSGVVLHNQERDLGEVLHNSELGWDWDWDYIHLQLAEGNWREEGHIRSMEVHMVQQLVVVVHYNSRAEVELVDYRILSSSLGMEQEGERS